MNSRLGSDLEQPHQELVKCVVVGDTAVGKTRLICAKACNSRMDLNQLMQTHIPTVWAIDQYRMRKEVLERSCEIVDGVNVSLRLWDTFGDHEKDRRFAYGHSDVVLLCFSIGSPTSLRNCKLVWYPEIRKFCPDTPIVLVGCKNDLRYMFRDEQFLNLCRERSTFCRPLREGDILAPEQGRSVAVEINAPYFESSVFTHYGISDVFENVIRVALSSRRQQRFWVTNLKNVKRPMLQRPFCPPRPMSPTVCITPSEYQVNLEELFLSQAFADVVIIVRDKKLYAHRILLTAGSPFFQRVFSIDLIPEERKRRRPLEGIDNFKSLRSVKDNNNKVTVAVTRNDDDDSGASLLSSSVASSASSHLTRSASVSSICSSVQDSLPSNAKETMSLLREVNLLFRGSKTTHPDQSAPPYHPHPSTVNRLLTLKTAAALISSAAVSCIPRPSSNNVSSTPSSFASSSSSTMPGSKFKAPFGRRKSLSWQDLNDETETRDLKKYLPITKELSRKESLLFSSVGLKLSQETEQQQSQCKVRTQQRIIAILTTRTDAPVSYESMKACLEFLYTERVTTTMTPSLIEETMDLSEVLEIHQLIPHLMSHQLNAMSPLPHKSVTCDKHEFLEFIQRRLVTKVVGDDVFTDVTFKLDDGCVSAHRPYLVARCEMMRAMFTGEFKESSAQIIKFPGVRRETFCQLLHYLYSDSVADDVTVDNCIFLLELANRLCIPRLMALTEAKVISDLKQMMAPLTSGGESPPSFSVMPGSANVSGFESASEVIMNLLEPSQMHNAEQLVDFCLHHICVNYRDIAQKQNKILRSLHPENQAYLNRNRWPPVWFHRELDFYERCVREREWDEKRGKKGVKRHRLNSGCLCFSTKSMRRRRQEERENYY